MAPRKHIVVLLGMKGAGKSSMGRLLEREFGHHFVEVEPLWMVHATTARGADWETLGWRKVVAAAEEALTAHDVVVLETTGAASWTGAFLAALGQLAQVSRVRVESVADECLRRVQTRSVANHIALSVEQVAEINRVAAAAANTQAVEATVSNTEAWDEVDLRRQWRGVLGRLGLDARALTSTTEKTPQP